MSAGGWVVSLVVTLMILGLVIAITVWAVSRRPDRDFDSATSAESAGEILDSRLAGGEISTDQYDELTEKLASSAALSGAQPPVGAAGAPR